MMKQLMRAKRTPEKKELLILILILDEIPRPLCDSLS
jgi:hypothetical protein